MPCLRRVAPIVVFNLITGSVPFWPQEKPDLNTYFKQYIGLTNSQIKAIRSGRPVAKTLRSRTPDEIFVFGAVYVHATPAAYVNFSTDFDRLRRVSGYLAIGRFSTPPRAGDLDGFAFDSDDIKSLKNCKPGDCDIQMPESSMQEVRR